MISFTDQLVRCIATEEHSEAATSYGAAKDPETKVKVGVFSLEVQARVVSPAVARGVSDTGG